MEKKIPVIAVVGPTASGKTGLAVEIAGKFNGEVVSADSMQIYSELSVGTAKPTEEEMRGIPHHLVGFISVDEEYSVVNYIDDAKKAIADIASRGKIPVLCGGTGLYIDSLLTNTEFAKIKSDPKIKERLLEFAEKNGKDALFEKLRAVDPETAAKLHRNNMGRVIRALEVYEATGITISEHQKNSRLSPSPYNVLYIGTNFKDREKLYSRIEKRIDEMLENGLVAEAEFLFEHGAHSTAAQAIGYKEFYPYFEGSQSFEDAVNTLKKETRHYAKRQLTWFRRNKEIHWVYLDDYKSKDDAYAAALKIIETCWSENEK